MVDTVDAELVKTNVELSKAIVRRLEELGCDDERIGRLSADLSDVYAESIRYRRLVDAFLTTAADDRDALNSILVDLHVGMDHFRSHLTAVCGKDGPFRRRGGETLRAARVGVVGSGADSRRG